MIGPARALSASVTDRYISFGATRDTDTTEVDSVARRKRDTPRIHSTHVGPRALSTNVAPRALSTHVVPQALSTHVEPRALSTHVAPPSLSTQV